MTIGVLGGGQLGWMLALAGFPLDLRFLFLDHSSAAPAARVAPLIAAEFADTAALERFASGLDVITYEFENVPVEAARFLADRLPVYPPSAALEASQDRLVEKETFRHLGIPTALFAAVSSQEDLAAALAEVGVPALLKTRRMGYDGKGQARVESPEEVTTAYAALGSAPIIAEGMVPFDRELSILAVRSPAGEVRCYPLVENHHVGGILRLSLAPAPNVPVELQSTAEEYARRVLEHLEYVGMLAIELFQVGGGLIANEMAPRVHNSGHWSIEGAETSQFANHVRAVAGLPLGPTGMRGFAAMVNLIGTMPDRAAILEVPGAHLYDYGKDPRPGRKLGHVTVCAETEAERDAAVTAVQSLL